MRRAPTPETLLQLGREASQAGRHDDAVRWLRQAASLAPNSPAAHQNLANALVGARRWAEALVAADRALSLQPGHPRAWRNRARCLYALGRHDAALGEVDALLAAHGPGLPREVAADLRLMRASVLLALGRADDMPPDLALAESLGGDAARLLVLRAAAGLTPPPPQLPPGFVAGLFDGYAATFEQHLVQVLDYQGPQLLVALLSPGQPAADRDVLDLGCGSGLAGPLLRPWARRLDGVDLAPRMVDQARGAGHYDHLATADALDWLQARPGHYDLVLAADMLIYVGELAPLCQAVGQALRPGGLWAVSIEPAEGAAPFELGPALRYRHRPGYLLAACAAAGLRPLRQVQAVLRREAGRPVPGELLLLQRDPGPARPA